MTDFKHDAIVLGTSDTSKFQKRSNFLRLVYTNPRYAPKNREAKWNEILDVLAKHDIHPVVHRRNVATYCGNQYLLPGDTLDTLEHCRQKGHQMGDQHGRLFPR
jgi:hypothetical protein